MSQRNSKDVGRIGFIASAFDLLHAGHIKMIEDAKSKCDYLIAALQTDPTLDRGYRDKEKNKPIQSLTERQIMIESIKYIDEVITYETEGDLRDLLCHIWPDIRILGSDWEGKEFTGCQYHIPVYFHQRDHSWSTTDLRERVYQAEKKKRS